MEQVKVKGKVHPITGHEGPEVEQRYSSILSFNFSAIRGWVINAMPWSLYPWDRPGTHCIEAGWAQGWSGWLWKISPPPGFNPWTIQLVMSCDIGCSIPAHMDSWNK
jgi:hypothetical protein